MKKVKFFLGHFLSLLISQVPRKIVTGIEKKLHLAVDIFIDHI